MKYIKQQICIFIFSLIYQRQKSITIARDLLTIASPLSYITQNKFIRSGLLDRVSVACRERQDWTAYSLLSMLKQVACTRHLLPTWKFFREARGSLSSSLISNQVHRGPMNNPGDISPTLNRHTSARMDVVTHRSAAFSRYFVIIFSARLPLEFGLQREIIASINPNLETQVFRSDIFCVNYTQDLKRTV